MKASQKFDGGEEGVPAWVEAIAEEIRKQAFYPAIHARKGKAFKVGFWLGHGLGVLPLRGAADGTRSSDSVQAPRVPPGAELRMIAKVTAGACGKRAADALEYFRGLTLGLQKGFGCKELEPAGATQTFAMYLLLVRNQAYVEELRRRGGTIRELADFILTTMPLAQGRRIRESGSLYRAFTKRIEKICQRIELTMASRGRPRRNSDKHAK